MCTLQRPTLDARSPAATVTANLSYLRPQAERPIQYLCDPPAGVARENCAYDPWPVAIRDARGRAARSIDGAGFALHDAPTRVRDFLDDDEVVRVYYPEIMELALAVSGGARAYVFDHLVRQREPSRPPLTFGREGARRFPSAAGRVHNDYTEASGRARLHKVLKDPAAAAAVTRFSILNLWRSITPYPVRDTPLAICDRRTVAATDLVASELRYADRVGEIYLVTHNPDHAWSYFPEMTRDEVLVFKQYDSAPGVARFTPHTAFDLPDVPPEVPPRQSIEIRCLVIHA